MNALHSPTFHLELTLYDILKGLKSEWDRLIAEQNGQRPKGYEVANSYDGSTHLADSSILQAANTVYRISHKVIEEIGNIINSERPDKVLDICDSSKGDISIEQLAEQEACRIFKNFITLHAIRGSRSFMNAVVCNGEEGEWAQIICLRRAPQICREKLQGC